MYIKSKVPSIILKLMIVVSTLFGIMIQTNIINGSFEPKSLLFFTILSNAFAMFYFFSAIVWFVLDWKATKDISTFAPTVKGMVTMSTTLTMIIAHFLLQNAVDSSPMGISMLLLHYIAPILILLDYFLFDKKGQLTLASPLYFTLPPLIYVGFIFCYTALGGTMSNGSKYPYPFLNIEQNGIGMVMLTIVIIAVIYIIVGYIAYFLDKALGTPRNQKSQKE